MHYFSLLLKRLSDLRILFWSTLWLMVLLTIGTVEQKTIGLFLSQEKYFSSLYFTYHNIPLPGGGLIIIFMCLGLMSQLLYKTNFRNRRKAGIALTHIGALVLLIGSLITNKLALEGSVIVKEGETATEMLDYKHYEFIIKEDNPNKLPLFSQDINPSLSGVRRELNEDQELHVRKVFPNCEFIPAKTGSEQLRGFATQFDFKPKALGAENTICIEFALLKNSQEEIYRVFQNMPVSQSILVGNVKFKVEVRNKRYPLPFSVKLIDFEKKFHQGTMISKSFKSEVLLIDGELKSKRIIEMNSPLRYKGYTFYQSSFSENSEGEFSEFSVVKNIGQIIPYISSIIICLGILLHLFINSNFVVQKGHYEALNTSPRKFAYLLALLGLDKKP